MKSKSQNSLENGKNQSLIDHSNDSRNDENGYKQAGNRNPIKGT
ncbi:hypothetical protein [Clostridium cylindrosporum]|uniref:Uncharacterized protein n=1 Tax=Clostridium cylindrosporum DSM 605 TaxID=1121307 RepID=A0A0J8DFZ4_CLOCY|nr:hypothetical protein [Clostridium cylindrosporum]KMT23154.1 hypothetical protein CLCY_6c00350 [Clostridium cylindrosporum DSM 605]